MLEVIRERDWLLPPWHLSGTTRSLPGRALEPTGHRACVAPGTISAFQPSQAADGLLPGSSKLQETNKMSPDEWMALQSY